MVHEMIYAPMFVTNAEDVHNTAFHCTSEMSYSSDWPPGSGTRNGGGRAPEFRIDVVAVTFDMLRIDD